MIYGKKAFTAFRIVLFVVILLFLIAFFANLFLTTKKAAVSLVDKELDKYQMEAGSYIHPDLPLAQRNFWENQFLKFVVATLKTDAVEEEFCYSTFYIDKDLNDLNEWSLTFLQEGENIIIQLEDKVGTVGAGTIEEMYPSLTDKQLCIRTADEREEDVEQITINFGQEESYYYGLQGGEKTRFYYDPYLHKSNEKINLFFYIYNKQSKKLCITPMDKRGRDNAFTHTQIESLLTDRDTGYPLYHAFCDLPKKINKKTCFYMPCSEFEGSLADFGLTWATATDGDLKKTRCGRFSIECGRICTLSKKWGSSKKFNCEPCLEYNYCDNFKEKLSCGAAPDLCNINCEWNTQDNKCVSQ